MSFCHFYLSEYSHNTYNTMMFGTQDGVPEQFWNCAEITIQPRSLSGDEPSTKAGSSSNTNNGHSKAILG
jgi:hypothetical protein